MRIIGTWTKAAVAAAAVMLASCGEAPAPEPVDPGPIAVYGNTSTFEIAPVFLAAQDFYPGEASVKMGSLSNLVGAPPVPGFGEEGEADVATNAETQLLRYSVENPNLRVILNVSQGLYRIVARKSAGIESVADLKGKAVATIPQTSSGYFFSRMLAREGLSFDDIEAKPMVPLTNMTKALADGEVDAVVIWEPESERSAQVLGDDLIEFSGEGVYAEQFNLNTTAEKLADPETRAKIVAFVRAIIDATAAMEADPSAAQAMVSERGEYPLEDVQASWKHHSFPANIPDNLLDILVEEELWLAEQDEREPRTREQLATLIDTSVYEEAMAMGSAE